MLIVNGEDISAELDRIYPVFRAADSELTVIEKESGKSAVVLTSACCAAAAAILAAVIIAAKRKKLRKNTEISDKKKIKK